MPESIQSVWAQLKEQVVLALESTVVQLDSVDAVNVDPDGAIVVQSRNVRDLQIELPRLAQAASITIRRVDPLDDSLDSVFGYLAGG